MKGKNMKKALVLLALLVLVPAWGWAAPGDRLAGPPPALSACAGKNAGDAVQFANRRGENMNATCRQIDGQLMAIPDSRGGMRRGGGDEDGKGRQKRPMSRLAESLNLTAEQQQQVRTILQAEQEKTAPLRTQMAEQRNKLRQAIHSGAEDADIRTLAAEQAKVKTELMLLRAQGWRQINALLTPEQRELAKTALPAACGAGQGRCGGCRD
ncbi:MAG: Spy/CpxP family protein refolding chaperone [Desulfuromonadales bacterium]